MDHLPEISSQPQTDSLPSLQSSIGSQAPAKYAAERARLMFGCYRKGDANDPDTYTAAVAAVLAEYSPEVIQRVTDPRTGLPRTNKLMPNPAEVGEACDAAKAFLRAEKKLAEMGYHWNGERYVKEVN